MTAEEIRKLTGNLKHREDTEWFDTHKIQVRFKRSTVHSRLPDKHNYTRGVRGLLSTLQLAKHPIKKLEALAIEILQQP